MSEENVRHMIDLRDQANEDLQVAMEDLYPIGCKVLCKMKYGQKNWSKGTICGYEAHNNDFLIKLDKEAYLRKNYRHQTGTHTVKRLNLKYIRKAE